MENTSTSKTIVSDRHIKKKEFGHGMTKVHVYPVAIFIIL